MEAKNRKREGRKGIKFGGKRINQEGHQKVEAWIFITKIEPAFLPDLRSFSQEARIEVIIALSGKRESGLSEMRFYNILPSPQKVC